MEGFTKCKAAVFDLDGTLLDTIPDIGASANAALRRFGLPEHSIKEYLPLIGHGINVLIGLACPEGTSEEVKAQVLAAYKAYYPEHCDAHTEYFPGVQAMLQKLIDSGVQVAILSNKTEATAQKIAKTYFPDVDFVFVWGNNGVRPLKPALDAAELICQELKLRQEEIAFVGDGDTDMEFGSKSGFRTIGVTWGYRSREVLQEYGAHALVDTMDQLLDQITG